MGYHEPRATTQFCPGCGRADATRARYRGFFSMDVRLECQCGVAGKWVSAAEGEGREPDEIAADGWNATFGVPAMPTPPQPRWGEDP